MKMIPKTKLKLHLLPIISILVFLQGLLPHLTTLKLNLVIICRNHQERDYLALRKIPIIIIYTKKETLHHQQQTSGI